VDLTGSRWWQSRVLSFRPREVHLGIPFRGIPEALALFEAGWIQAPEPLELELDRIRIPPVRPVWHPVDWRSRYVFEFLLPPAERVFAARQERAYLQTHPVDESLSLDQVREQLSTHARVAEYLHRQGLRVYVRDDFDALPKTIDEHRGSFAKPKRSLGLRIEDRLRRWLERLSGLKSSPILEELHELHLGGTRARVKLDLLPVEIVLGPQRLQVHVERPLVEEMRPGGRCLIVFDPVRRAAGISGFVRLGVGQRTRIGKGEEDRQISLDLPKDILPRLELGNEGEALDVVDLHSPTGADLKALGRDEVDDPVVARRRCLDKVREIFGQPLRLLEPDAALDLLREVNAILDKGLHRPKDSHGKSGGLLEIDPKVTPIIVGDLHASLDNLLKILSENRFLDEMVAGRAAMILLGDAVHHEDEGLLEEMDSSVLMMDLVLALRRAFPSSFFYLQGNHDSFSHEVTKEGVPQSHMWRERMLALRGEGYVREMQQFYDRLPYVVVSHDFVACHAGPPTEATSRQRLVDVRRDARLMHQLTWNRIKRHNKPIGYTQREVRGLIKALKLPDSSYFIVSHNPQPEGGPVWTDLGGIKNHHLLYSARSDFTAVITRVGGEMVPLIYPCESLLGLVS
jgi:predicted phosphodiesterase